MSRNLTIAVTASLLALFTTLILAGAGADTRIADAAMNRDRDAVRSLIKQAVDVNTSQGDGMTALHWAALNGDVEIAQVLINAGANVKATTRLGGYAPLFMAAKAGFPKMVDLLLKSGSDAKAPAIDGITSLMMAASAGSAETIHFCRCRSRR